MEPYRPSNGTEGVIFMSTFCAHCRREAQHKASGDPGDGCPIIANAMVFGINEDGYPTEWVQDETGPRCTAFELDKGH